MSRGLIALTATEFFGKGLEGASPTEAARECKLPTSTVRNLASGFVKRPDPDKLKELEAWSKALPSARKAGVFLSCLKTLGLDT